MWCWSSSPSQHREAPPPGLCLCAPAHLQLPIRTSFRTCQKTTNRNKSPQSTCMLSPSLLLNIGKTPPSNGYNGSLSFTVGFLTPSAGRKLKKKNVFLCEFPCLSSIFISMFFFWLLKTSFEITLTC